MVTLGLAVLVFAVFSLLASGYAAWIAYQEKGKKAAIAAAVVVFLTFLLLGYALTRFILALDR